MFDLAAESVIRRRGLSNGRSPTGARAEFRPPLVSAQVG
jgi:hypothetical protein